MNSVDSSGVAQVDVLGGTGPVPGQLHGGGPSENVSEVAEFARGQVFDETRRLVPVGVNGRRRSYSRDPPASRGPIHAAPAVARSGLTCRRLERSSRQPRRTIEDTGGPIRPARGAESPLTRTPAAEVDCEKRRRSTARRGIRPCPGGPCPSPARTVGAGPALDVGRYTGTWHQLAAVPQPFSLELRPRHPGDVLAARRPERPGPEHLRDLVRGPQRRSSATHGSTTRSRTAQLHVSFPGVSAQDSPDGPTNYVVTYLADDYSWALVGDPARFSGFVLSRSRPSPPSSGVRSVRWSSHGGTTRASCSPHRPPVAATRSGHSARFDGLD